MKRILFVSNGHGEDLIASKIIKSIKALNKDVDIFVLPMIGKGFIFSEIEKITIIGPQKETNSGGFISWKTLLSNFFSGIFFVHLKQLKNAAKKQYDVVVTVGDFIPFFLSFCFLKYQKIIMIATAKSDFFQKHFLLEKFFIKKAKACFLARDRVTADNLLAERIDTKYLGNVMMDSLDIKKTDKISKNISLGILPGSRKEAYDNIFFIKKVIDYLPKSWKIEIALSSNLDENKILAVFPACKLIKFEEMLKEADAVIGMAGTANEQVIGCGIPLFVFVGKGPQTTKKRFLEQKKLLGDLPVFIDEKQPQNIAKIIIHYLKNEKFIKNINDLGSKVMGEDGASNVIANYILH
jgi:hypothetical protein